MLTQLMSWLSQTWNELIRDNQSYQCVNEIEFKWRSIQFFFCTEAFIIYLQFLIDLSEKTFKIYPITVFWYPLLLSIPVQKNI